MKEMADDIAKLIIDEMEEYESGLSSLYDGLSKDDLNKVHSLLVVLYEKWSNDETFNEATAEVKELKRILKRPFKRVEWKIGNPNYPTKPSCDLDYVECLLKKEK